ncbi:hypothetical protein Fmac_008433 [Flemingia macrophylla]|uniref:Uncharacterized protein n=1 Tax=Flemingia macrophylla TaxID=520843 RepID=A0ABD1MXG0_9FABA
MSDLSLICVALTKCASHGNLVLDEHHGSVLGRMTIKPSFFSPPPNPTSSLPSPFPALSPPPPSPPFAAPPPPPPSPSYTTPPPPPPSPPLTAHPYDLPRPLA